MISMFRKAQRGSCNPFQQVHNIQYLISAQEGMGWGDGGSGGGGKEMGNGVIGKRRRVKGEVGKVGRE